MPSSAQASYSLATLSSPYVRDGLSRINLTAAVPASAAPATATVAFTAILGMIEAVIRSSVVDVDFAVAAEWEATANAGANASPTEKPRAAMMMIRRDDIVVPRVPPVRLGGSIDVFWCSGSKYIPMHRPTESSLTREAQKKPTRTRERIVHPSRL